MKSVNKTKPLITVIVPYGYNPSQPQREEVLHFITEKCLHKQSYKNIKLVLVECSPDPSQKTYVKNNFDDYLFIPQIHGPFSVGQVQNLAVAKLNPQSLFYIHLPDFLLPYDSIEKSLALMSKTDAPCIFPFYGAVSLTKPVTEGILSENIDWRKLLESISKITTSKSFKNNRNLIKHPRNPNRVQLSKKQIDSIDSVLPEKYRSEYLIQNNNDKDLWGDSSNQQFNFYGTFKSPGNDEALGNFRTGPRAKPSYLCLTNKFVEVGGTTVSRKGWNCEDLWFWEKLRTVDTNYVIDKRGIYYRKTKLSGRYPVAHLWHNISAKLDYYKNATKSISEFRKFALLSKKEKLQGIKPLDIQKLIKCQHL